MARWNFKKLKRYTIFLNENDLKIPIFHIFILKINFISLKSISQGMYLTQWFWNKYGDIKQAKNSLEIINKRRNWRQKRNIEEEEELERLTLPDIKI